MSEQPNKIALNLDDIEREDANVDKKPFNFVAGGKEFTLTDPADLDWQKLLEIDDPIGFFKHCMPQEQKTPFLELKLPAWKLGKIIEAFQEHYGLDKRGNGIASRI